MRCNHDELTRAGSRPTRARGLKHARLGGQHDQDNVAPHAGAWIETNGVARARIVICPSRPTRARGLKPEIEQCHLLSP